jgi:hypothetical protein
MFLAIGLLRDGRYLAGIYLTGVATGKKAQAFMWSREAAVNLGNIEFGRLAS